MRYGQIDMGQMPLDQMSVNPHSAQLSIYVDQISQLSLANYLDLSAYAVINPSFDEASATWNAASRVTTGPLQVCKRVSITLPRPWTPCVS